MNIKLDIEIPDEEITSIIKQTIAKEVMRNYSQSKRALHNYGIEKAVKEVVYEHRAEITERVIERASKNIANKAFPKLVENMLSGKGDV